MLIGLLSDTHSHLDHARRGIAILLEAGATRLIHCGDVGSDDVIELLADTNAAFVFGNNDYDHAGLRRAAMQYGVNCLDLYGTLELAGKRLAVTHGDDGRLLRTILDAQQHDYLFTGHTHAPHDERFRRTRAINPGALYRAKQKTVATLDLTTDVLTYYEIEEAVSR